MESFILPPFPTPAATHHWDPPKGGCKETARAIQVTTRPAGARYMGPQRHFRKSYFFRTGGLHFDTGTATQLATQEWNCPASLWPPHCSSTPTRTTGPSSFTRQRPQVKARSCLGEGVAARARGPEDFCFPHPPNPGHNYVAAKAATA